MVPRPSNSVDVVGPMQPLAAVLSAKKAQKALRRGTDRLREQVKQVEKGPRQYTQRNSKPSPSTDSDSQKDRVPTVIPSPLPNRLLFSELKICNRRPYSSDSPRTVRCSVLIVYVAYRITVVAVRYGPYDTAPARQVHVTTCQETEAVPDFYPYRTPYRPDPPVPNGRSAFRRWQYGTGRTSLRHGTSTAAHFTKCRKMETVAVRSFIPYTAPY